MLVDAEGPLLDLHLLERSLGTRQVLQFAATARTGVIAILAAVVDLLGRERGPLVAGVSGLAASAAFLAAGSFAAGAHHVAGRRLGRVARVLAGRSQLAFQVRQAGLQLGYLGLQCWNLLLQGLAAWAVV
jgi:hypothetical protein